MPHTGVRIVGALLSVTLLSPAVAAADSDVSGSQVPDTSQYTVRHLPPKPLPNNPSLEDLKEAYGEPPPGEIHIIEPFDDTSPSSLTYTPSGVTDSSTSSLADTDTSALTDSSTLASTHICTLTAGFPFRDGGYIRGRGHVDCGRTWYHKLTAKLQQYRGAGYWRTKATRSKGPTDFADAGCPSMVL